MEILVNNGHNVAADELENVCLSGAFPVENGAVSITDYIPATDNVRDSGDLHLEDESMTVNSKKRAFDEDPNGLQSPSKKLAVRSSPEALVDAVLFSSSLAEAMVIDTTWEESGEKELDNLPMPGFPEQIPLSLSACTSIPAPSPEAVMQVGEPECSETAQEVPVVQESPETSLPVNSNVDETKIEEDLIEFHSAQLESIEMEPVNGFTDPFKMMKDEGVVEKEEESLIADDVSNGLNDSLGLMKEEVVVEKEEESLMLEDFSKDSHVIFKTGVQVVPNEALEERAVAGMDMETSVAETVTDGGLPQSSPTGVNLVNSSVLHVAGASPTSGDDVSASEVQRMPMSSDSHTPQAFEGMKESDVTDSAPRSVNDDEAGVGDGNEINEVDELQMEKVDALQMEKVDELQMEKVDELQMEKVDAAKALELKMVEVIMQSTDFVGRNDGSLNPLSDPTLIVHEQEDENGGEDTMIGLCDEDKFADLFEPVVQLPEHPEGTNGFLSETLDIEGLRNGQVSEDLHLQHERHAKISRSQDPADQHVPPNKDLDFSELSGSGKGDSNMDRQFSEVLVPSGVTSTQPQSSGLKAQQKMKEHGEIATKSYPNFAAGRALPVKEILLKEAPASAKLLLASGLLDGHYVRYLGRGGHVMLTGIIREGGVLCDCSSCKGLKVVNVSAFEKHAGSSARHPSDFIFLENGKCLKDILEIGWNSSKQDMNVMEVLKTAIGEIGGENIKVRSQENPIVMNQSAEKKLRPSPEAKPRIPLDTRPRLPHDSKPSLPQEMKPKLPLPLPQELKPKVPQETKPSLHSDMNLKLPQEMKPNLSQEFNAKMPLEVKSKLPPEVKPRVPQDMKPRLPQEVKPRLPYDTKPRSTIEVKLKGSEGRATQPRDRAVREKESVSPPVLSRETSGANLHKALFLPGGLEDDTELGYYVKGQKFQSGVKRGAGILCSCCEQVISCSLFEQHAGWGSRRNPYTSIYLADGRSLHDAAQSLIVEQTVKQEGITPTKIEHLDQCVECGDSVDLLLCTGCPNAYHQDCLGLVDSSTGEFFCPDCQEQRFGGTKDRRRSLVRRRSQGAPKTLLTRDRVTGRSTRLLEVPEAVVLGGCVFCKSGEFAKSGFGPLTTLLCDQCEREYHVGCLKQHGLEDLKELPDGEWFCGQDCKHIHTILSLLVSNGPEPLADSVISKVLKSQPRLDKAEVAALQPNVAAFEWQLLHGRGGDPLNGKTLAEAVQIFAECFDPIADGRSGGDLIPLMVYRRSIRDQDFGGIYCVVLKQDDKVVSTALIRVFGRQLAELPLLATNPLHQGQGHCKALLLSIERLLGVLRVQRLALPAAEGAEGIWLNKFGFRRMLEDQVQDFHTNLNMMIFTGSIMLEKEIPPLEINTRIRKA